MSVIAASAIGPRLDEIYDHVADNQLGKAIQRLLDLAREFGAAEYQDAARALSMTHREVESRHIRRLITDDDYDIRREQLAHRLFDLARRVVQDLEDSGHDH